MSEEDIRDRLARAEEELALSKQSVADLTRQNDEFNENHAIAMVETQGTLLAIQQENTFQNTISKLERKLHTVTHATTKQRVAQYNILICRLQWASSLMDTFPNLSADQRVQLEQHVNAALRGLCLMATSCTLMDDPSYSKNEPLATYMAAGYLHNMFGASTSIPLAPKYQEFDFMAIDEKIERKLFEKAPTELKEKPTKEVAVVQPVVQPVYPPYPYPFHFPAPPQNPPPQNQQQQHHQIQQHMDAPRGGGGGGGGGWNKKARNY